MSIGSKDSKCIFGRDCGLVVIWENRSNVEIAFHTAATMRFGQLENLFDAAVSSWISHILNPW